VSNVLSAAILRYNLLASILEVLLNLSILKQQHLVASARELCLRNFGKVVVINNFRLTFGVGRRIQHKFLSYIPIFKPIDMILNSHLLLATRLLVELFSFDAVWKQNLFFVLKLPYYCPIRLDGLLDEEPLV
jgi:hypothetical protein